MKNIKKYGSLVLITLIILISFVITNMGSNDNESNSSNTSSNIVSDDGSGQSYHFRNDNLLTQHFQKHGNEFSYSTKEEYEAGASAVINTRLPYFFIFFITKPHLHYLYLARCHCS